MVPDNFFTDNFSFVHFLSRNTTDYLRRERALGNFIGTMDKEENILTFELDGLGHLVTHNSLGVNQFGLLSKTLIVDNETNTVKRIYLNVAPGMKYLSQLTDHPFNKWLCDSVKNVIQQVLDAVEAGKPPNQTWRKQIVEISCEENNSIETTSSTSKSKSKSKKGGLLNAGSVASKVLGIGRTLSSRPTIKKQTYNIDPIEISALLLGLLKNFTATYCKNFADGESRLLGLFAVNDSDKHGLLPLSRFYEVLKFGIGTPIKLPDLENVIRSVDSVSFNLFLDLTLNTAAIDSYSTSFHSSLFFCCIVIFLIWHFFYELPNSL